MHFDTEHLRQWLIQVGPWVGHLAIWAIVFAESGLLVGFFLPGDSLLFTAGFLASVRIDPQVVTSATVLHLSWLVLGCMACAIAGDNVGYATGARFGRKLFQREDSRFFKRKHLITAQNFYQKHGKMAIVLARFTPIVRTFAPIVAGIGAMNYRTFLVYNVAGGMLWTLGLLFLGYNLGQVIGPEKVDQYLLPIIVAIIVVSFIPSLIHIYQERKASRH
ncbi:VTT domain-containing protein [Alkalinema pantanalense CENA528]|uniref:VTT domain-containing protein n=1 Tax=Alkalinema pantanalense TaxID=1620705 RepID=UPI003D70136B